MFDFYVRHEYWFAAVQLVLAMLGMGATLTPADFARVFAAPRGFVTGMALQLLLVPAAAYGFIVLIGGSPGVAIGLAICAAVPGGSVTNIFTYLARGNVPLSIALTGITTALCLVTTPLILELLVSPYLPVQFEMPAAQIATEIALALLLPLAAGMLYLRMFPASAPQLSRWCVRGALVVIALIVAGALGAGRLDVGRFGLANVGWVLAFIALLATVSSVVPQLLRSPRRDVIAINIEVTVRNTNLGLLIKASLLPAAVGVGDPVGDQALFTILVYAGCGLAFSGALIPWHRRARRTRA